ncbi:MAG: hypothetical protein GY821_12825 [Gammaproteobacteria bacterium]|nr:hypothetical protein [Gammaproteobacteria bacterium]
MQKFNKGDHVQVAKDLGEAMSHFRSGCEAIVIGSYDDQFGGGNTNSYTIYIKDVGKVSWYFESQLELIKTNQYELLECWKVEAKKEADKVSNLDWIFEHGKNVLKCAKKETVVALAECFGLTNLWGSKGEGFVYYSNAMLVIKIAEPFLKAGDKEGWINYCKTIKNIQHEKRN